MRNIRSVLFDLDGTLLDTAPDLVHALNVVRFEEGMNEVALQHIRPIANLGSKAMVKRAFDIEETDKDFDRLRERFLHIYQQHLSLHTRLFPEMETVLSYLDQHQIPWGIVTSKLSQHAHPLLKALQLHHRPACLVCGDSLSQTKPHPAPILHACQQLKQIPGETIYLGDAETDVLASKAAGTVSFVALYGYIQPEEKPLSWQADGYIKEPLELINWLNRDAGYPAL